MAVIEKKAYAKINLTLEILGRRRGDGFHDIASVMHKIDLHDTVRVTVGETEGITLVCDKDVCAPEENLAYRAAKSCYVALGRTPRVHIEIRKSIPAGAGLAGGSADAAAVLDALGAAEGSLTDDELSALALSLGSDVPFCLERHSCAKCTGRGEIMEDLPPLALFDRVRVEVPETPLSTGGIYAAYDERYGDDYTKNGTEHMAALIGKGAPLEEIVPYMNNDFEALCVERCPAIGAIRDKMRLEGLAAQMSGSGSAVFGIRYR